MDYSRNLYYVRFESVPKPYQSRLIALICIDMEDLIDQIKGITDQPYIIMDGPFKLNKDWNVKL